VTIKTLNVIIRSMEDFTSIIYMIIFYYWDVLGIFHSSVKKVRMFYRVLNWNNYVSEYLFFDPIHN